MVTPLTDAGAVKATTACPLPGVTVPIVGALGTVAVAAQTSVAAFKRHKVSKQDFRGMAGGRRDMFIGLSSGVHTK
jgi:hypothetical protein